MFPSIKVITEDFTTIVRSGQALNAVYAGYFERGPVNEITQITSIYDLKITFGKPTKDNYKEWFQIYNYLSYGNACIYIARCDAETSTYAKSPDFDISAKYPGEWGNNLLVKGSGENISVYLNNKLVEKIDFDEESYYINYKNLPKNFETRLRDGFHDLPSSVDIADSYALALDDSWDFDFILANPNYQYPAISLAQKKLGIAFLYEPVYGESNCICYQGSKKQRSIFDGKLYEIPILGDATGLRNYLANSESLRESHCKRSYSLVNIESAKIPDLRALYNLNINGIAKNENYYYFNSETMCDSSSFTNTLILNRLKKETADAARYFVFEMADDFTRNDLQKKIQMKCQEYKDSLYIVDFMVVCNDSNQSTIEPNSIYVDIYVKMSGIIEEVLIKLKAVSSI